MNRPDEAALLTADWNSNPRWAGLTRPYTAEEVVRLRGSVRVEHTLARLGAEKLWGMMKDEPFVRALGALTGGQAVQMVDAGLRAIYVSGWQVAAEANDSGHVYPDQSLYAVSSVPNLVRKISNALLRADQIQTTERRTNITDYIVPMVADAEAGFGGLLNAYELMKAMIEAGAAGVHFEDQLSSEKKCGHLGGKVLVPTSEFIQKLIAARLAADVLGVPTLLIARTDAHSAQLLTTDSDPQDHVFMTGERSYEGFYRIKGNIDHAIARALAYAPYADLIWCETATPDMEEAEAFAHAVHAKYPGKMLAYNCSPSFNWRRNLDANEIARFQNELGAMGYAFQFITLAGFHSMHSGMYELAHGYSRDGMTAFVAMQEREFALEPKGFRAIKHQGFVGTGYFDAVQLTVTGGQSSTTAISGSTEAAQFAPVGKGSAH